MLVQAYWPAGCLACCPAVSLTHKHACCPLAGLACIAGCPAGILACCHSACCLAAWLAGLLACLLDGWGLAGWLACWVSSWLAGWGTGWDVTLFPALLAACLAGSFRRSGGRAVEQMLICQPMPPLAHLLKCAPGLWNNYALRAPPC